MRELKKEDAKAVRKLTDILLISQDKALKRGATTELHKMGYPVRTVAEVLDLNRAAICDDMASGKFMGGS